MKFFTWRGIGHLLLWGVILVLFWWLLRTITWTDLRHTLQQLTPGNVALLVLANLVVLSTLGGRWWLFLNGAGYTIPFGRLLGYRLAAFAVSYFTPGPHLGGEPLQVYLVSTRHGVPTAVAIATVTLDKLFDLVVNALVLGGGLAFLLQQTHLLPGLSSTTLYLAVLVALWPLPVLLALYYGRQHITRWLLTQGQRYAAPMLHQRLSQWLATLAQSEAQVVALWQRTPGLFLLACLVSLVSWGALVGEFWYMTTVLGFGLALPEAFTLLLAMRLAILLPLPAGLGALEASLTLASTAVGLPPAAGLGLSLLIRLRDVSLGLVGLWLGGNALRRGRDPITSAPIFQASRLHERWSSEDMGG